MPADVCLERDLVAWLTRYLDRCGATVANEVTSGSGRIDLVVTAQHRAAIEAKATADRQSLCSALGQALTYRAAGFDRVAVAAPHAEVARDLLDAYETNHVQLIEIDMDPRAYTALQPAFPNLYPGDSGFPWGQVISPHAHLYADPRRLNCSICQSPRSTLIRDQGSSALWCVDCFESYDGEFPTDQPHHNSATHAL